jgi:hypothetical protein
MGWLRNVVEKMGELPPPKLNPPSEVDTTSYAFFDTSYAFFDAELIRQAEDGDVIAMVNTDPTTKLDLAVAKAIGLEDIVSDFGDMIFITPREWDEVRGIKHPTCEGDVACVRFQPSVDLNAAFAAAEAAGVFNEWSLRRGDGDWYFEGSFESTLGVEAPTPALAICAAILKLKEHTT